MINKKLIPDELPEYPFIKGENRQIVGYVNECKYGFQCGCKICVCTNPKNPIHHCFFGWHTGGLIPDALCNFIEPNPNWHNATTNFLFNRKLMIEKLIKENKVDGEIDPIALDVTNPIQELIHKPINIFLVGIERNIKSSDIYIRWPWLKNEIDHSIHRIEPTTDFDKLKLELDIYLNSVKGMGILPFIMLKWDTTPDDICDFVFKIIKDREDIQSINIATRLSNGNLIQNNELLNLSNLNKDIWMFDLKDFYKDKTILCVTGGPSLTNQFELIKQHRDKYIILAVTTAVKPLIEHGIIPDLMFTIDMKNENVIYLKNIPEEYQNKIPLIYEIDANNEVVEYWKGTRIMLCANIIETPILSIINEYYKDPNYTLINKSGTVSNLMYQVAKYMGAKEILLVGYDLCYPTGNSHVEGAMFNSNIEIIDNGGNKFIKDARLPNVDQAIEVKDTQGNIVYTTKAFYTYWLELNVRINTEPKVPTYDLSPIGIKKENVEYIDMETKFNTLSTITNNSSELLNINTKKFNNKIVKNILMSPIKHKNASLTKQNHMAKLTYMGMHYMLAPYLKYDNIDVKLNKIINEEADKLLNPIIEQTLEKFKINQKENNNG